MSNLNQYQAVFNAVKNVLDQNHPDIERWEI